MKGTAMLFLPPLALALAASLLLLLLCPGAHAEEATSPAATSSSAGGLSPETIQKYFTDEMIQAEGADPKECAQRVFAERERRANMKSLGVEPTVGLGWALLIFVFVGFFAAGIAQTFQQVSTNIPVVIKQIKRGSL